MTSSALNDVFIDDTQGAETHVGRVVVVGKGEAESGIEPAMVGVAAIGGLSDCKHWNFLVILAGFHCWPGTTF